MGVDTRASRRTYYERCVYYSNEYSRQEVLNREADAKGVFYAREVSSFSIGKEEWQNAVRRDRSSLSLETVDEVDVNVDDWVMFDNELYIVDSVSFERESRSHAVSNRPVKIYRMGIRK